MVFELVVCFTLIVGQIWMVSLQYEFSVLISSDWDLNILNKQWFEITPVRVEIQKVSLAG